MYISFLPTQHGNPYGDMSEQEDEASSDDSDDDCDLEQRLSNDPLHVTLVALAMLLLVIIYMNTGNAVVGHYIYKHWQCCCWFI